MIFQSVVIMANSMSGSWVRRQRILFVHWSIFTKLFWTLLIHINNHLLAARAIWMACVSQCSSYMYGWRHVCCIRSAKARSFGSFVCLCKFKKLSVVRTAVIEEAGWLNLFLPYTVQAAERIVKVKFFVNRGIVLKILYYFHCHKSLSFWIYLVV